MLTLRFSAVGTVLFELRLVNRDEISSELTLWNHGCPWKISARLMPSGSNGTPPTVVEKRQIKRGSAILVQLVGARRIEKSVFHKCKERNATVMWQNGDPLIIAMHEFEKGRCDLEGARGAAHWSSRN
ncbi:MAG: hypothetical protein GY820_36280 [Gammaproteobacteria bacterium]|nr:hypothetical protein [Gammaproteobacteria bacterium]